MKLSVFAPVSGPTGYDEVSRLWILQMFVRGHQLEVERHMTWTNQVIRHRMSGIMDELCQAKLQGPPDFKIHICLPDQFTGRADTINVNYTMFEASGIPAKWVQAARTSDYILLPTKFNHDVWVKSGVPASKLRVVPIGIDTSAYCSGLEPWDVSHMEDASSLTTSVRFLHIQEVISRKNIEGLLDAWTQEVTMDDDACLLIKVNSHSGDKVSYFVNKYVSRIPPDRRSKTAPVLCFTRLLPEDAMPPLYSWATHYVSASCGEGWGMNEMKAAACGKTLVIPTHSGFSEWVLPEAVHAVPSIEEAARQQGGTFVLYQGARWWRPTVLGLRRALRAAIDEYKNDRRAVGEKAVVFRDHIVSHYDSTVVGEVLESTLENLIPSGATVSPCPTVRGPFNFAMVVRSFGERCGIGNYVSDLYSEIKLQHMLQRKNGSCMLIGGDDLGYTGVLTPPMNHIDLMHLHFEYQFHSPSRLAYMFNELKKGGMRIVVTPHTMSPGAYEYHEVISKFADAVVFSMPCMKESFLRWGGRGMENRTFVVPLGMKSDGMRVTSAPPEGYLDNAGRKLRIGFFGFSYFHKGIDRLLLAARIARVSGCPLDVRLLILSNKPRQDQVGYFERCKKTIEMLSMQDQVEWDSNYLSEDALVEKLSTCHLLVLPYSEYGGLAASAAGRTCLKAGVPMLVSDTCFFEDLPEGLVTKYKGFSGLPPALLRWIYENMTAPESSYRKTVEDYVQERGRFVGTRVSFSVVGAQMLDLYQSILGE